MRRAILAAAAGLLVGLAGGCAEPGAPAPVELPAWAWAMPDCVAYQPQAYQAPGRRVSVTAQGSTVIESYEPGWGPAAMADILAVLGACGSYEQDEFREQHTVVVVGFVGTVADDSLLVESVRLVPPEPPLTWYATVVRFGDVVVTTRTVEPEVVGGATSGPAWA